jgi:hypothetical protein
MRLKGNNGYLEPSQGCSLAKLLGRSLFVLLSFEYINLCFSSKSRYSKTNKHDKLSLNKNNQLLSEVYHGAKFMGQHESICASRRTE